MLNNRSGADRHPKGRSVAEEARERLDGVRSEGYPGRRLRALSVSHQFFERCSEGEALAWPVVQDAGDVVALRLSKVLHRASLRQILPNETVRVLVRAALPGVVGRGEVERHAGRPFDFFVAMELCAVVDGDGLEQTALLADELDDTPI